MHPTEVHTTRYGTIMLPNKHLSYSAIEKFNNDKEGFRKAYYEGLRQPDTMFTMFGREVHERIDTDPQFKDIRLQKAERKLEFTVAGIPVLGYIDTSNDLYAKGMYLFGEYKTGIRTKDNKAPWTQTKVNKHNQLPFYSLGLQTILKLGKASHDCFLVWLETQRKENIKKIGGATLNLGTSLELTGHTQQFERTIYEFERKMIREWIIQGALEIGADFKRYLDNK